MTRANSNSSTVDTSSSGRPRGDMPAPVSVGRFVALMGPLSSHPNFRSARIRWMGWMVKGITAVILGGTAFILWNAIGLDVVIRFGSWLSTQLNRVGFLVATLGFLMSAMFTLSLQVRMSAVPAFAAAAQASVSRSRLKFALVVLVLLAMAALIPYFAAKYCSGNMRLFVNLVAVMPLPALMIYVEAADDVETNGSPPSLKVLRISFVAVFGLSIALLLCFNQWIAELLTSETSAWISRRLAVLPWGSWVQAGGAALTDQAPAFLKSALSGSYGEDLKVASETVLKEVGARLNAGAQSTWAGIGNVFVQVFGPIITGFFRVILALLVVPLFMMTAGFSLWVTALANPSKADSTSSYKGWIGRALSWLPWPLSYLSRLFSRSQRSAIGSNDATAVSDNGADSGTLALPSWVGHFLEAAGGSGRIRGVSAAKLGSMPQPDYGRSAPCKDAELAWLFDQHLPTEDQQAALEMFTTRYLTYFDALSAMEFRDVPPEHPDMFLQAMPGAGSSSTLRSMAVYASAVRGQRVLYIASSKASVDATIAGLASALNAIGLSGLVRIGSLRTVADTHWCQAIDGMEHSDVALGAPDVLVATLSEWEAFCQNPGFEPDALRRAVLGVEVVLVDDFGRMRGDIVEAMHLPFVLGKHRLLLRSECRPFQLVVAAPIMEPVVADSIAVRLFGGNFAAKTSTLRRWTPLPPVIDIEAQPGLMSEALHSVAGFLLSQGMSVLVFRPGAGAEECARLRGQLRHGDQEPQVVSDLDQLPASQRSDFDAVIYRRSYREEHAFTIAARLQSGSTVFLRVHEQGAAELPIDVNPMPVLASLQSRDLTIMHLKRLSTLIESGVLVNRHDWARFGLEQPDCMDSMGCVRSETFVEDPTLPSFLVDPPDAPDAQWVDAGRTRKWGSIGVWNAVALERLGTRHTGALTSLGSAVPDDNRVEYVGDQSRLVLGRVDGASDPRRFLVWMNQQNQELEPAMDLAHMDRLLRLNGDVSLLPTTFRELSGTGGVQRIDRTAAYRGLPEDSYIPTLRVVLDIEPHASVHGPEIGPPVGVEWYAFRATTKPLRATVSIIGIMNERGEMTPRSPAVEFRMDASVSAILIGMPIPDSTDRLDRVRAMLGGTWKTQPASHEREPRAFWPLMTRALNAALRSIAPELPSFARFVAFRAPRGGAGCCVMVIEPIGTTGTARDALATMLRSSALRSRLLVIASDEAMRDRPSLHGAIIEAPSSIVAGDREEVLWYLRILCGDVAESIVPWKPQFEVGVVISPAPDTEAAWFPPRTPLVEEAGFAADGTAVPEPGSDWVWKDYHGVPVKCWKGDLALLENEEPVTYGVALHRDQYRVVADAHNAEFGFESSKFAKLCSIDREQAVSYLRECGMNADMTADYGWMAETSRQDLRGLAKQILERAEAAGAVSIRAKLAALYTFVISHRYEHIAELPDGRQRWGVRMPAEMLHLGAGDCDSASVLLLSLIRAAELPVKAGVVVTHNHAILGVQIPITPVDDYANFPGGPLVLLECTEGNPESRRIGRVHRDLVGTAVQVLNFG